MGRLILCLMIPMLAAAEPEADIRKVLDDQVAAWNRGDVAAFMRGYDNSAQTAYVGAGGVTKGYQQVLDRYRKKYASREAMGKLTFSNIELRMLGSDNAVVIGRFQLVRTEQAGGDAAGWFTLIFVKRGDAWKIIHDHTS